MQLHRAPLLYLAFLVAVLLFPLRVLSATGTFPTAVFLVNFQDNTSPLPLTRQEADQFIFSGPGSVHAFYREVSYGKALLTGTVFDWVTLPINTTCSGGLILNEVVKKFSGTVNFQDYKKVIIISMPPAAGCNPRGYGGGDTITTPSGTITVGYAWLAAFSYATMLADSATLQEVGHTWVTWHSHAYECGSLAFAAEANCTLIEYGNPYDVMGGGKGHFNGYNKELVGWLDPSNVVTVTQDGDYTIEALEITSLNPKLLKILIGATNVKKSFYVDYRQPIGFDTNLVGNMFRGASVYYVDSSSYLLDTTPGSKTYSWEDIRDGALEPVELQVPGQALNLFHDPASGVTLTTHLAYMPDGVTPDPERITVRVAGVPPPPPCVRNAPNVFLRNTKPAGGAGATFSTEVHVSNQDYMSCEPSTFSLLVQSPNGWSGSFSPVKLTINPQRDATAMVSVTSPPNAADGLYRPFVVTANNDNAVGYSGSADTFYVVDDKPPTVSITAPGSNQSVKGTVNVAISAADNVQVGYVELFVDGKQVGFLWLSPYSVAWNTAPWSNGAHTLQATALDIAGLKTTSAPVTVYVDNAASPTIASFSPASGPTNTYVVIQGVNLTGTSSITFNGVKATVFQNAGDTYAFAFVPSGATTGPVCVTTSGGTGCGAGVFTITP